MRDPDLERPIFVLAGGWRSGSTLLQRLLCSHPEVMVWGESRGLLDGLRAGWEAVEAVQPLSEKNRAALEQEGHQGWIALANPPFERFREALRAFFLTYLAEPAAARGRPRWGFKEVRHDAPVARWLHGLFPEARFVFLVRHPAACLASARGTTRGDRGLLPEVGGSERFLAHWTRITRSFVDGTEGLPGLRLRYE
ncbi:MAG: sulfotransferase, partial [Myxococcota bacterium]|nr:sulfotransferase [Myxococcota bacterium]